jgi:hypothetical protein
MGKLRLREENDLSKVKQPVEDLGLELMTPISPSLFTTVMSEPLLSLTLAFGKKNSGSL